MKIIAPLIVLICYPCIAGAEELLLREPSITDEKYQSKIENCTEQSYHEYNQNLGILSKITETEENKSKKIKEFRSNCTINEHIQFNSDYRSYKEAKAEFERNEQLRRQAELAAKQEKLRQAEEERREAEFRQAEEQARIKKEKELAHAEANAWKKYVYGAIAIALIIGGIAFSNSISRKRNEEIRAELEKTKKTLAENIESINRGRAVAFDNRDNISGFGAFVWADYQCDLLGRKDVTRYKSASASYSKTGDRKRQGNTLKGRGRVSVGGVRGKYEKVDEEVNLGAHNVYVTSFGLYICGDYPKFIERKSVISFRITRGNRIQVTCSSEKYPFELRFKNWGRAEVFYAALQSI